MKDGKPIRLKDVADVVIDHQPMIGDGIINDGPGLLLIVEKFPWGNTLQVTRGVEEALDAMRPGLPDVDIDSTIFRPATYIETSIDKLTMSLMIGCVLLVMVLFAFLYEWRVALISCIAMPLSLVGGRAGAVLHGRHDQRDDSGRLRHRAGRHRRRCDHRYRKRRPPLARSSRKQGRGKSLKSMARIILEASLEVRGAIVYATLIEVFAILPVFFMQGLSGAFFKPLAMCVCLGAAWCRWLWR